MFAELASAAVGVAAGYWLGGRCAQCSAVVTVVNREGEILFSPHSVKDMRRRFPLCLKHVFGPKTPESPDPGDEPECVFDFKDGLRLSVWLWRKCPDGPLWRCVSASTVRGSYRLALAERGDTAWYADALEKYRLISGDGRELQRLKSSPDDLIPVWAVRDKEWECSR